MSDVDLGALHHHLLHERSNVYNIHATVKILYTCLQCYWLINLKHLTQRLFDCLLQKRNTIDMSNQIIALPVDFV